MNEMAIAYATEFLGGWLAFRARQVDIPGFSVAIYAGGREIFSIGFYRLCRLGQYGTFHHTRVARG